MTQTRREAAVEIPGEWLGDWTEHVAAAVEATYTTTVDGRGITHSWGHADLSVRVVPGGYATDREGRDWAGHGSCEPVGVLAYDDGQFGPSRRAIEGYLRRAVETLAALPSGMGWRHGEVVVSVRTVARPGHRARVIHTWVPASVAGRGITFRSVPGT